MESTTIFRKEYVATIISTDTNLTLFGYASYSRAVFYRRCCFLTLRRKSDSLAWDYAAAPSSISESSTSRRGLLCISLRRYGASLVVFWRNTDLVQVRMRDAPSRYGPPLLSCHLSVSLPRHFQINQAVRQFGLATEYMVGSYEESYEESVRSGKSLNALLPENYRLHYPEQPWGTDARSWIYYANRTKPSGTVINYVVQSATDPPPPLVTQAAVKDGIAVNVQDLQFGESSKSRLPKSKEALYERSADLRVFS